MFLLTFFYGLSAYNKIRLKGWSPEKAGLVFEIQQEVKIMPDFLCGPDKIRQF